MEASSMINTNADSFPQNSDSTFHNNNNDNLSHSAAELEASGIEIEMMKMVMMPRVSYSYTSLRDIMPLSSLPHPNNTNSASWNEIPINIKNPLLKQAAISYLQPMSTPPEAPHRGFFHSFCGHFGCFGWLCGDVFNALLDASVRFFCGRRRIANGEEEDQHQEHDDDDGGGDNEEEEEEEGEEEEQEEEEDNVDSERERTDSSTLWNFRFDQ